MKIQGVKTIESRTLRSFRVKLDSRYTNGHDFCELMVDEENKSFTARLYGKESYSYSWSSPGKDFIVFLIETFSKDKDYLYGNLENHALRTFIDTEKTAINMKKIVLKERHNRNMEEDETRELWEEIESFEHNDEVTESHFYEMYSRVFEIGIKKEIFSDEPWFEEFVEHKEDDKCRIFCEKVAPILAEVLKKEYGKVQVKVE